MISGHPHPLLTVIVMVVYPLPSQFCNISNQSRTDSLDVLPLTLSESSRGKAYRPVFTRSAVLYVDVLGLHIHSSLTASPRATSSQGSFMVSALYACMIFPVFMYHRYRCVLYFYCPFSMIRHTNTYCVTVACSIQ